jgi:hypothetical protein
MSTHIEQERGAALDTYSSLGIYILVVWGHMERGILTPYGVAEALHFTVRLYLRHLALVFTCFTSVLLLYMRIHITSMYVYIHTSIWYVYVFTCFTSVLLLYMRIHITSMYVYIHISIWYVYALLLLYIYLYA